MKMPLACNNSVTVEGYQYYACKSYRHTTAHVPLNINCVCWRTVLVKCMHVVPQMHL